MKTHGMTKKSQEHRAAGKTFKTTGLSAPGAEDFNS